MSDREAILAALRGARCEFHAKHAATHVERLTCTDCDLARADAVLAAAQAGESRLLRRADEREAALRGTLAEVECVLAQLAADFGDDDPEDVPRLDPAEVLARVRAAQHLAEPADTAALDAALRKARADALREAAAVAEREVAPTCDLRDAIAARLRRMADDAEAE